MTWKSRILIVEDDETMREFMCDCLTAKGFLVEAVTDGVLADARLASQPYNVVLVDLRVPGLDGLSLLARHVNAQAETHFILISGFGTIDEAVRAMKLGATDFITKPVRAEELVDRVEKALCNPPTAPPQDDPSPVGRSPRFREVVAQLALVAPTPTTVLLTGETGTGKEVAARQLHRLSPRSKGPWVSLNCGAVPDSLLEDELFGHVRGAFTGASSGRPGCFELAHGGTLFLDEIGTMGLHLQTKLLRILQDPELRRLGDTRSQRVDVRIVTATNCNLKAMVAAGSFRADLYYRLSVFPIELPPLRERPEDILPLAYYFSKRISGRLGVKTKQFAPAAETRLLGKPWPGNVRQLENAVERAVVLARDREVIEEGDLLVDGLTAAPDPTPPASRLELAPLKIPEEGLSFASVVSQVERQLILKSLEISGGNKKQAARLLQMKRTTLIEKLRRLSPPAQAV